MEDCENDSELKRTKDRSPSPAIKSTAVVKYTAYQTPVSYARLQCNTDLNLPPSNWGAEIDTYGLKEILTGGSGFSSFRMAHMFPDCVGDVDVISGAECIKKLLKLPYQPNGTVSMMVHRVENTLLLDDFDIYNYLMKSEWSWLKDFFYENILKTMSEQERAMLTLAPAASSARQLTRRFLSHSVSAAPPPAAVPVCLQPHVPFLPEPEPIEVEPPNEHLYNRNVLWTFENIQMLIGSDLPIFGDKDRPCVSLRLRDAREPINVLTGIDYWLDNLMCNVPEVLMCYHLDGIVQKYEPMKTEDLPNMENSKFSPKVIRNVAQNILSFLKSNATKAGHTYWLFKGPHDDVVKLYDLTSLCPDSLDNPFTTPVAMLLYRVARNMRITNRSKHVKQLLEHVIELLKVERYPQIVASSHYMLADLFVPATTNPASPDFKDESSDSDEEDVDFPQPCEQDDNTFDSTSEKDANSSKDTQERDIATLREDGFKERDSARRISGNEGSEIDKDSPEKSSESERDSGYEKKTNSVRKGSRSEEDSGSERHKDFKREEYGGCGRDKDSVRKTSGSEGEGSALAVQMRGLALRNIGDRATRTGTDPKRKRPAKGLGADPPSRCGAALQHALAGLRALHHVTTDTCKEEERERLKQQILIEEQHPKMANPFEPIKMNYEPLKNDPKEHVSRSRRRKLRKSSQSSGNCLIEASNVDKNAILIRKENNTFPSLHEPNRDDNFAWKLHLKTLLYEKICLVYATLAEYSYSHEQFGFSLKYIDMASKCQMLLSNMIIKSRVVDAACLIGRVGDNYFQLSKHWRRLEQFRAQFDTEHATDRQLRDQLEGDLAAQAGDEFRLDITLPKSEIDAMLMSMAYYRRAVAASADKRSELQRRLASVSNELAVRYMLMAQEIYLQYAEEVDPKSTKAKLLYKQFSSLSKRSLECLDEATEIFQQVNDVPNLALLYCNKGRYMRFKAHCSPGDFNAEKRSLYNQAEDLYLSALKLLGPRETCGAASVWELVSWELSCHLYTKAALMQDTPGEFTNEVSEVAEAFKHALKYCLLSPGPRQYLYQFRAAMIYHRLGSLYHSQYRITHEDGPKRRALVNATRTNYSQAANMFAALEDAGMFLTAQLEHVAVLETQANVSPNLKLKSLQTAIQLLRQCHSIMRVIKDRDPEDQKETQKPEEGDEKTMKSEHNLLSLYENRLHFILRSIIQYCRSKSNKDYERMTDMYKKLYSASLRIKKDENARLFAASVCDVLDAMDEIAKEFEQDAP